jgi:hypothetical protein
VSNITFIKESEDFVCDNPSNTPQTCMFFSKDNFLKRHSNKLIVFSQRHLTFPKFPSGPLDAIQLLYAMRENTFAFSKIMERKGERFSFIFHHEVELSMLCTGFTLD